MPTPTTVTDNPNATAGLVAGSIVTVVAWGASLAGADIPPEVSAAAVTLVTTVVLYIGRKKPA